MIQMLIKSGIKLATSCFTCF